MLRTGNITLLLIAALTLLPLPGRAQSAAVPAAADSCSAAFATSIASMLRPEMARRHYDGAEQRADFAAGVAQALRLAGDHPAQAAGLSFGLGLIERLDAMRSMGFPIATEGFASTLQTLLEHPDSAVMGFDNRGADAYLHAFLMSRQPKVQPLSEASQSEFLDTKKRQEAVTVTPSGLLFEVITEGEGPHPAATDRVRLTYTGSLADGTVFDKTDDKPVTFPVANLVPGFSEGLQLMKPGGTYRLFIPPQLGYGDAGAGGGVIPPNAALQFDVTLLEIVK